MEYIWWWRLKHATRRLHNRLFDVIILILVVLGKWKHGCKVTAENRRKGRDDMQADSSDRSEQRDGGGRSVFYLRLFLITEMLRSIIWESVWTRAKDAMPSAEVDALTAPAV